MLENIGEKTAAIGKNAEIKGNRDGGQDWACIALNCLMKAVSDRRFN